MIKTKSNLRARLFILFLILNSSLSYAQSDEKKKDKKYRWGCAVAINSVEAQITNPLQSILNSSFDALADKSEKSVSLSISPKYFITDYFLLHIELGITNIQFQNNLDSKNTIYHNIDNRSLNEKIYRFNPGIEYTIIRKKRIDLYC